MVIEIIDKTLQPMMFTISARHLLCVCPVTISISIHILNVLSGIQLADKKDTGLDLNSYALTLRLLRSPYFMLKLQVFLEKLVFCCELCQCICFHYFHYFLFNNCHD